MNALGKTLVMIILVVSVFFMALTMAVYSTHRNWRDVVQTQSAALTQLRATNGELTAQRDKLTEDLKNEQEARQQSIATLETTNDDLRRQRDQMEAEQAQLVQAERQAVATMEAAQTTLAGLRQEVDRIREEIRTAQADRDEKFRETVDLTDQLHVAQGEQQRLEAVQLGLLEQVTRMEKVLERNSLDEYTPVDGIAPLIDGIVLDTRNGGWIEVSLGSDDGLRTGHTLEVYRDDRYLGRIEVVKTSPDKSVAKIVRKYLQGRIQREDRVASRIN